MGAGSWGSVFSMILSDANCDVTLWARSSAIADDINSTHINHAYQPDLILPANVVATANPDQALTDADLVVLAMPAQTLRSNLTSWSNSIPSQAVIVSLMKGVELGTAERMTEVIAEVAKVKAEQVAVVSGPNLAHEIAAKEPAATTVACSNEVFARRIQDACTTEYFRPY
jgi:glycerol-3-phosphate dehydrogenase (NAD(P)+)